MRTWIFSLGYWVWHYQTLSFVHNCIREIHLGVNLRFNYSFPLCYKGRWHRKPFSFPYSSQAQLCRGQAQSGSPQYKDRGFRGSYDSARRLRNNVWPVVGEPFPSPHARKAVLRDMLAVLTAASGVFQCFFPQNQRDILPFNSLVLLATTSGVILPFPQLQWSWARQET